MATKTSFTAREIASRLGVSVFTVRREIDDGILPAQHIGGQHHVLLTDLQRYIGRDRAAVAFGDEPKLSEPSVAGLTSVYHRQTDESIDEEIAKLEESKARRPHASGLGVIYGPNEKEADARIAELKAKRSRTVTQEIADMRAQPAQAGGTN